MVGRWAGFSPLDTLKITTALFAGLLLPAAAGAQSPGDCLGCEAVQGLQEIQSTLDQDFNAPIHCLTVDGKKSLGCDFASLCQNFSANSESSFLYENAQGDRVPNFKLLMLESGVAFCNAQKKQTSLAQAIDAAKSQAAQANQAMIRTLEASQAFAESVRRHHEQGQFFELSQISVTLALKNAKEGKPAAQMPMNYVPDRDEISAQLSQQEAASGQKLSDETRKDYIEMVYLQYHPSPDGAASPSASSPQANRLTSRNRDPFLDPGLLMDTILAGGKDQVLKNQALYQSKVDRAYEIFETTQAQLLAYLDRQKTGNNDASIENLKTRVRTIGFHATDPMNPQDLQACRAPNAFYFPIDHVFHLCPQFLELPGPALKLVIGHEISHSIDPCTLTDDLLEIQGTLPDASLFASEGQNDAESRRKMREKAGLIEFKLKDPQPAPARYHAVDWLGTIRPQLDRMYLNPLSNVVATAIPDTRHPFAPMISCLAQPTSVGARRATLESLAGSLDQEIARMRQAGATPDDPGLARAVQTRAHAEQLVMDRGACSFLPSSQGQSQLQEAFADKIAGELLALDLADPKKTEAERHREAFEANTLFLSFSCPGISKRTARQFMSFAANQGCSNQKNKVTQDLDTLAQAKGQLQNEHPFEVDRLNRLLMVQPEMRRALGCKGIPPARYCP